MTNLKLRFNSFAELLLWLLLLLELLLLRLLWLLQ
jgi:hypothetical protein